MLINKVRRPLINVMPGADVCCWSSGYIANMIAVGVNTLLANAFQQLMETFKLKVAKTLHNIKY